MADERTRDERIEEYYHQSAWALAERIVDLEDELGADVDGMCTGMHADVAEARAEVERLSRDFADLEVVGMAWMHRARRFESAWKSARRRAARNYGVWVRSLWEMDQLWETIRGADDFARQLWKMLVERRQERDRYRHAWLSARRRAADEANFGMEALDRERARQASFLAELRPLQKKRMDELRRLRAFAADVSVVRDWTMDAATPRDLLESHLRPIYSSVYELEEAEREGRVFRTRSERRAIRGDLDDEAASND
ncbi:hypothetical protein AB0F77_39615 [Streptomyces sp. NPDC026672]|uniref:hypothetical protein n=1 Tax=Actinomycetes TaxID=1760 RepID=UPI0033D64645